jgi:hypothetical protein
VVGGVGDEEVAAGGDGGCVGVVEGTGGGDAAALVGLVAVEVGLAEDVVGRAVVCGDGAEVGQDPVVEIVADVDVAGGVYGDFARAVEAVWPQAAVVGGAAGEVGLAEYAVGGGVGQGGIVGEDAVVAVVYSLVPKTSSARETSILED